MELVGLEPVAKSGAEDKAELAWIVCGTARGFRSGTLAMADAAGMPPAIVYLPDDVNKLLTLDVPAELDGGAVRPSESLILSAVAVGGGGCTRARRVSRLVMKLSNAVVMADCTDADRA